MKNLFKKTKKVYNYEDFDTDDDEDLDMVPEWMRERLVYKTELEKCIKMNSRIMTLPIFRGSMRSEVNPECIKTCEFKFILI